MSMTTSNIQVYMQISWKLEVIDIFSSLLLLFSLEEAVTLITENCSSLRRRCHKIIPDPTDSCDRRLGLEKSYHWHLLHPLAPRPGLSLSLVLGQELENDEVVANGIERGEEKTQDYQPSKRELRFEAWSLVVVFSSFLVPWKRRCVQS
jgi:hypothetical protein